jgi:hypothetical protein
MVFENVETKAQNPFGMMARSQTLHFRVAVATTFSADNWLSSASPKVARCTAQPVAQAVFRFSGQNITQSQGSDHLV